MRPTKTVTASLRHQNRTVWLFVLAAIVTIGVLLGLRCFVDYSREVRLLEEHLMAQAKVVDENLNANLSAINLTLENIRQEINENPADQIGLNNYLKMQADLIPGIRTLLTTDSQGRCLHSNHDILIGQDSSGRDYFTTPRDAADRSMTFMSPPFRSLLGKFVINITKPVLGKQGEFKGVISVSLQPEYFMTLLKSTIYAPDNRIGLAHSDGVVFTAIPDGKGPVIGQDLIKSGSLFFRHMRGGRKESFQIGRSLTSGDKRAFAYITNTPKDLRFDKHLVVAASRNMNEVLLPWKIATGIQLSLYLLLSLVTIFVTKKMLQRGAELTRLLDTQTSILASAGEGILGLDHAGNIVFCNQAVEHLTGRSCHELIGHNFHQCFHCNGSGHEVENCPIHFTLKDGVSRCATDCVLFNQDAAPFPVEYTVTPLREKNNVVGAVLVFRDVTEQRKAASERARSAEYNQAILDSIRSHIAILDKDGLIVSVNDAWLDFADKNRTSDGELPRRTGVGTNYLDICRECADENAGLTQEILDGISSILKELAASFTCEYPCHSHDVQRWFFMSVDPLRTQDGGAVVTHVDITRRKQMEAALQLSEGRLQRMFKFHGAVMLLIDPGTGAIIDANLSAEKFYGYPHNTLLTMNIADINTLSHDDIQSEMRQAQEQQRNYFIFKHKVANGSIRTVEVYSSPITMQDKALLFSIIHDITDRKLAEEAIRDLEHHLFRSQKLESLVRMSGGIAHDFNNLLQVVVGNLDVTLMKLPQDAPVRRYIGEGIKAAERAAELSRMMLVYSGKGYLLTKELNLTRLVEESSAMLSAVVPSAISFEFKLDPAIPFVTADAGKLLEVIVNMVSNAAEAIGEAAGLITMSTGVRHFEQVVLNTSRFEEKLAEGRYVWLEVRDTGCGMDDDTAYKLFDPFFTTKFTGRGLGMSAAYGIIRAHKGAFLVESKLGYGTTILFLLPIAEHLDEQTDHPVAVEAVLNHIHDPRTILIIDDEEMIRSVSAAMLGECGFETIEAADGEEALRIFREQGDRIDLVLLDACMPQMDGLAVFKELRRIRPEIKVLLATGYSKQQVAAQFSGQGLNGFIQKPYTLDRLSDGVRRALKA
jgi:PAS domain S-box-containing protein